MDSAPEKRRDPRVPLVLRVDFPGGERGVRDTTENLSASGLFLRTERPLQVGERLPLQISFPGLLAPVTVEVEVVRQRAAGPEGPGGVAVRLPDDRAADRQTLARLAGAVDPGPLGKGGHAFRVLVVEDNPHVVSMYEYALRKLRSAGGPVDVLVEFAGNGHEALARLAEAPADLVMADLYMPVMDGFTLVERIRAEPSLRATPVMVISGGDAEAERRALDLGVDVFLRKPVQFAAIIGTVRALLRLAP
jgi:uncharacterized protein (TIGR02266 family)